ncbi:MAG: OmpA family protein [Deltaproteobacteria bacterium]|nr:OmpA family protein [Deltaproteobacteria bacterium]
MSDDEAGEEGIRRVVRTQSPITLRSHEFFLLATGPIRRAFLKRQVLADAGVDSGPVALNPTGPIWFLLGVITLIAAITITALIVDRRAKGEEAAHLQVEVDRMASTNMDQASRIGALEQEKASLAAAEIKKTADAAARVQQWRAAVAPALQAELARVNAKLVDDGDKLDIQLDDDLLFDGTRTELRAGGEEVLTRLGAVLATLDVAVDVVGHTDDHTARRRREEGEPPRWAPSESLWGLAAARATLAARVLIEQGEVPAGRVTVVARGKEDPLTSNCGPQRRAKNRRLELTLRPLQ